MEGDSELSRECATYAESLAGSGKLKHSDTEDGENLAMGCSSKNVEMSAIQATKNWYKEACSPGYDFTSETNERTGHFTQVVWKKSKTLGIGKASKFSSSTKMYCTYIVARYRPAGNMMNNYRANVPRGAFSPDTCKNIDKTLEGEKANRKTKIYRPPFSEANAKRSYSVRNTRIVNDEDSDALGSQSASYYLL